MRRNIPVSQRELWEMMSYNPDTGTLRWLVANGSGVYPGDEAGTDQGDYLVTKIGGVRLYLHRVIWFWMTGEQPECEIDHRDTDKKNNRWNNLRLATFSQNKMNVRRGEDCGLRFFKTRGWQAYLCKDGISHFRGYFPEKEQARQARRDLEAEHFGEFACSIQR